MAVVWGDLTGLVQRFHACLNSCSGQDWLALCNFPIRYVYMSFCLPSICHVIIPLIRIWLLGIPTTHCPFRIMHDTIIIFLYYYYYYWTHRECGFVLPSGWYKHHLCLPSKIPISTIPKQVFRFFDCVE